MKRLFLLLVCSAIWTACYLELSGAESKVPEPAPPPIKAKIIFDTDIGNDVDDALAVSVIHALQTRKECDLLAVTVTKPDELSGPFVNAMNTFYGRPKIPIGCIRPGSKNEPSKFLPLVEVKDGNRYRYPHRLKRGSDAPEATKLLRRVLARQGDASVVLIQVGLFSNFAALLDTLPDEYSPLAGRELVRRKVKFLSVMGGAFQAIGGNKRFLEFNVVQDLPASKKLATEWPTPIFWSGFEIGIAVPYPAASIEHDFGYVAHHLAAEAYWMHMPPPHERPCWDLTSVLYAVLPDRGFFGISEPGNVTVEQDGFTRFTPAAGGRDQFLTLNESQKVRVREALVQLASQPPTTLK